MLHVLCVVLHVHNHTTAPRPRPPPRPRCQPASDRARSSPFFSLFPTVADRCTEAAAAGWARGGAGTARRGAGSGSCAPGRPLSVASTPGRSGRSPRRRCNRGIVYPYMH